MENKNKLKQTQEQTQTVQIARFWNLSHQQAFENDFYDQSLTRSYSHGKYKLGYFFSLWLPVWPEIGYL